MSIFAAWPEQPPLRRVFLKDMVLHANIGIYPHEQGVTQRIRVNISFGVEDEPGLTVGRDDLSRTVSYERIVLMVRRIIAEGHVRLVETLAERIAIGVLTDDRVIVVRVRVEKLDIFDDLDAVGVEIERRRPAA
ncbi:dihydroneopterin aldolase [Gluconacetobacter diazotrophicus PA1 5]|uniref:7,8-dihydroneopterin aldolase n=2 Tax=Gluconacetobacter diazotrophicus TaxID=33996 RepID=A9H473_GLUDA|nr:dihydroneopterin aldolase [Gluconacetobacter diazotrophicus]ACI52644.1 dihydroneopterin aldolase [Gluconacetobacter diazotrophicus PA1 5]MBB2156397.1 dihydroneopterin aldolase [Gluconacetobacter diazotrophicus]TWB06051.1 dihydroneopterin aldolase [Gluconacetobacter diazotrophicus]CAP57407.1 putative dihydroneopterin aldolase [Gluconacetobacter diazotrophicus PA1 5]